MTHYFDVDSNVIDPDLLNRKVLDRLDNAKEKYLQCNPNKAITSQSKDTVDFVWSEEDVRMFKEQLDKLYSQLQSLNAHWNIREHTVSGSSKIACFIKRIIWKVIKVFLKPLVSSISDFNLSATLAISEIINMQEMVVSKLQRRHFE